ncbi:MAG: Ldh family oxidoreductase [Pseudomonas veronii]|jgi:delta1-piperideine-2-carboxylate reductase|nr:Ldh family oxidoreductase [Pseudomonas veronii]
MSAQSPRVDNSSAFIGFNDLVGLLHAVFVKHGTSPQVAQILAHNCASAERDGAHSHGIFRMPGYISTLESGWVDGKATPVVTDVASGFVRVDAANGFAQPALAAARALLVDKARSAGIALLAIHNSHHFAALWPDVEPFAEQGLVALSVVNSMTCVVPHGADRPLFGTNPIAFAAPRADGAPIVFDLATSAIAHGDVQIAARNPASACRRAWASTAWASRPRTPRPSSKAGALLPFGGHKGSALSMMVELLAAALTGGNFSFEFNWADHPGARTPWTGQLLILIDPSKTAGQNFAERSQELVRQMHAVGLRRLPGDRRHRTRAKSLAAGIEVDAQALNQLREWAV